MIDLRIPLLLAATMAVAFGAALLGLRHSLAIEGAGVNRWAQGDLVGGGALLLLGLHDGLPDMLTVAVAEVLLIAAIALQHRALRSFFDLAPRTTLELVAVAFAAAQTLWFWYLVDVPGARVIALASVAAAVYGSVAVTILAPRRRSMPGATLIGTAVIVLLMLAVVRTAIVIATSGTGAELLDWHPIQVPFYFSAVLFVALTNLGFVVMIDARRRRDLERLASIDGLTGLVNRRMLMTIAEKTLAQAARTGRPLALMMLDLDRFKALNDRYGHAAGDDALARFARIAESGIRTGDVLGRYGGEEFVAVLPDTTERTAAAIAERVRSIVEDDATRTGSPPRCTVSIGVVGTTEPARASLDELLRAADEALYRAKRSRNAVTCASAPEALAEAAAVKA